MSEKDKTISLTDEGLEKLIRAIREPIKTQEQINAEREQKEAAVRMAAIMREKDAQEKANQDACSHTRFNGTTCVVFVESSTGSYLLCQHCNKCIWPNKEPELFNKLFQLLGHEG
jgi:hypothetical protein